MIRIAALLSTAAVLTLLALSSGTTPPRAEALIPPIECDGKIGVVDNEGFHPFAWDFIELMNFTPQPAGQDGSRDFTLGPASGDSPIPIAGTIDANGDATGVGSGTYSGFSSGVTYDGSITYFDMNSVFPRRIIGDYTVGGLGELPGGKTIVIRMDCWFDPPEELADPDGDDDPGMRHDTFAYNSLSAGRADGGLQTIVYRDAQNMVQNVEIADPDDVTTSDNKQGPFETSTIRKYYDTWGKFGGSFSPALSNINGTLWPEIGSPSIQSAVGGVLKGRFRLGHRPVLTAASGDIQISGETSAVSVISFEFDFHAHAVTPFAFLGVNSGDWSWRRDPEREIVVNSLNLATGQASLTVPVLLDADNLRGVYADTPASPAGVGALPGEPIRFSENVNIAFPPLGLITSAMDNCPDDANPDQGDSNADGLGDACEGMFWMDADCDAGFDTKDVLATLSRRAEIEFDRPSACPEFDSGVGAFKAGDWDCDDNQDGGDIIAALLAAAALPPPADYPAGCPEPGELIFPPV